MPGTPERTERFAALCILEAVRDHSSATQILTSAFADDPLFRLLCPDASVRPGYLERLFDFVVERCGESNLDCHEDLCAIWTSADDLIFDAPASREFRRMLLSETGALASEMLRRLAAVDALFPQDRPLYLFYLAVTPRSQGLGIGSAYLREQIASRCPSAKRVYLESSNLRNVPFYEANGFHSLSSTVIDHAAGVTVTTMTLDRPWSAPD